MLDRPDGAERPLKILMVSARYLPFTGGTETHVHEVGTRLADAGHAVTVLTADPDSSLPAEERVGTMQVVRVRAYPKGRDWCLAPGLLRHVAGRVGRESDVIHIQGYHTLAAPFAMLAASLHGTPFVLTFHSGGHSSAARVRARGLQQAILGPLASRAAQLIGVSEFEAAHFSTSMGIDRDRFVVVPNGASLPKADAGATPCPDRPLVVSLGRLERYKGHHRAIEAFVHLRRKHPGARLRILGEGPYKAKLIEMISQHGLSEVATVGAIAARDRGAMATFLSTASLVVLLSDYEAHPVAVMEALSLGRPVLTSDTSGFRELAERGLVRSLPLETPPEAVAAAMSKQMAHPATAAVSLPNWDECAAKLLAIYRCVVAGKGAAPAPSEMPAMDGAR
ncbi:glycosyltransferase family 4 protein [Methylobacterium sp. E-016]|uniref:glycosyltransferase family 4 protein n=1 Tax=Methylobacterium sp. E-016 TaxID=2836556 RepID=UPI001FBA7E17|nr:glycosyltransferase family 4 protein [Methylobacterium sp. E-016]MCJ2076362.1 glycosyltransferase family 4 protein [Methylobacterium sp. E-016]